MLEHNQIISRRRVANCIYGRLNAKQIEVEVKPVDIVSSRRITETKIPFPTRLARNCFFSLNSRNARVNTTQGREMRFSSRIVKLTDCLKKYL